MKKNLITKALFLAMGLCVASGITATLVSTNKSAVAVHAAEPIVVYIEGEPGYDVVGHETWVGITGSDNHGYAFFICENPLVSGKTYKLSDMNEPYRCELSGAAQEQATDATFLLKDNGDIEASMTTSSGTYLIKTPGPKVGDKFAVDGLNYEITSVGDTNTVKVGDNTSFAGTEVIIPSTVTYSDVTFDVTEISDWAFIETGITEIEIPASVTTIGEQTFEFCYSLTEVTFAENSELVTIGDWAFDNCTALKEFEIPDGVTSIGEGAFNYCIELEEIEIPASVITLCKYAFSYAKLTCVTFAENSQLKTIGVQAFEQTGLAEIEIPTSVSEINKKAFYNCANLSVATILATNVPTTGENIFGGCNNLETIYVPASSLEAYQTAWADYASKIKALHNHAIKEIHDKIEPTCLTAGHKVYYECSCGKYFSDEALTQEITNLDAWLAEDGDGYIAPKGHSTSRVPGVTPTETTDGYKDAFKCNVCGQYFEDADGTKLIGDEAAYNAWKLGEGKIPALNPQGNKGLSGGAIAGIAVGSAVVVGLGVFSLIWFGIKKKTFADLIGIFKK